MVFKQDKAPNGKCDNENVERTNEGRVDSSNYLIKFSTVRYLFAKKRTLI